MTLKAGARLRGLADTTEVVVVRAPMEDVDLRCGGHPVLAIDGLPDNEVPVSPDFAAGTKVGKRYVDEASGLELLCTKAGEGTLAIGDTALALKEAKPLPSSD